jgi:hypothetical protein
VFILDVLFRYRLNLVNGRQEMGRRTREKGTEMDDAGACRTEPAGLPGTSASCM